MINADPSFKALLGPDRFRNRRAARPQARFVDGDPVPWMGPGEGAWSWMVGRELPHPMNRPYFSFTPERLRSNARRGLDDYVKPVIEMLKNDPVSLWATFVEGDRFGLRIGETSPAFPPVIDRILTIDGPGGLVKQTAMLQAMAGQSPLVGHDPVGIHVTLPALKRTDFAHGGSIRVIFDGLSTLLGGDLSSPADTRIWDLRVVRDSRAEAAEVRIWTIR